MSNYLLLLSHYEKLEGEEWEDMSFYSEEERWEEDRKGGNPSKDVKDRKKDEPDSKDERKCSKSETDKSE